MGPLLRASCIMATNGLQEQKATFQNTRARIQMYKIVLSPTFASTSSLDRTIAEQAKLDFIFGNKFETVTQAEESATWITGHGAMFTSRIEKIQ